jgi:transposase
MAEPFLLPRSADVPHRDVLSAVAGPGAGGRPPALSGIIYVIRNGLMWRDAPPSYGAHKRLQERFVRCTAWACSTASSQV